MTFHTPFPDHLSDLVIMDCDDVLLDWLVGFRRAMLERGMSLKGFLPEDFSMFDWLGIQSRDTVLGLVREFNASPAFSEIPMREGAVDLVNDLLSTGHRIHVVTACSSDPRIIAMRRENLANVFGSHAFEEITCIPLDASKADELARRPPALWFDDRLRNVIDGINVGHHGILVGTHNNHVDIRRASDTGVPWIPELSTFRPAVSALPHVVRKQEISPDL